MQPAAIAYKKFADKISMNADIAKSIMSGTIKLYSQIKYILNVKTNDYAIYICILHDSLLQEIGLFSLSQLWNRFRKNV